jgi:hypothetical protein
MKSDFELIQPIADAAVGRTGNELTFTFPQVMEVVQLCTINQIAVLGVELFEVRADGYCTKRLSTYDQGLLGRQDVKPADWDEYVRKNNSFAEEFIRKNPAGDDHVYILTNSSWREFCKIQEMKRQ